MADVDMAIAGRSYRVACADGQEASLAEAGAMIAREADVLREQFGNGFSTLSEARVLLMAGLMLADRVKGPMAAAPVGDVKDGAEEPEQQGLFEDPAQAARIKELEAALAAAQQETAAAVAALEDAARQVREMTEEMVEDAAA